MIIWKHQDKLSKEHLLNIKNIICQEKFLIKEKEHNYYTTYYNKEYNNDYYNILNNYYCNIQEIMMKDLGLFHRTNYNWQFWIQMYNNQTNGFGEHDHFTGTEFISWVHFLQVPEQKCFYFLDSNQNKIYPEFQSNGDMISFPSWVYHGVDKVNINFDRIIISGNISITHIQNNTTYLKSNTFNNTTLWTEEKM